MNLIYFDESGNTGTNLKDPQQPVFLLAALIVPVDCWQQLEADLEAAIAKSLPGADAETEIHCANLRSGTGSFKGVPTKNRADLRDDWLKIAARHNLKVAYRTIEKKRFEQWLLYAFGPGVLLDPYVAAFPLVACVINEYLRGIKSKGMFISDENTAVAKDIEKSIKLLRVNASTIQLTQIIEKGFFIDSKKSRAIQLCDMLALTLRRSEENKILGAPLKDFDKAGIDQSAPLIYRGSESFVDVVKWLAEEWKKK